MPDPSFQDSKPQLLSRSLTKAQPTADPSLPACTPFGPLVDHEMVSCRRRRIPMVVLRVALHGLNAAEEHHGTSIVDQLRVAAWSRLRNDLRSSDLAVRTEGCEFGAILIGASGLVAAQIEARLTQALSQTYSIGSLEIKIAVSVGSAVYPLDGDSGATLVAAATQARTIKAAMS